MFASDAFRLLTDAAILPQAIFLGSIRAVLLACVVVLAFVPAFVLIVIFVRIFSLWLRAFLAEAYVSVFDLVGMMLRRTPMDKVVELKIMAVQAGVPVTTAQIESGLLQGADVERAVLAMIVAQKKGMPLGWEDAMAEDTEQRLREKLQQE